MFKNYFTLPSINLPQNIPQAYKFKKGDHVYIDATPEQRKSFAFKYSLNKGKLQNKIVGIIKSRKLMVRKNVFFPYYTILIGDQVKKSLLFYLEPILIKKYFLSLPQ